MFERRPQRCSLAIARNLSTSGGGMRVGLADLDASAAEPDLVHDAAGRQREEAGDHQCASEEADHGGAVGRTEWWWACQMPSGSITSVKIDSKWMGLHS